MTVQDDFSALITDLEQILWEGQLSQNQEVSALLERVRYYLLAHQSSGKLDNYEQTAEKLTQDILTRLEDRITPWLEPLADELENLRHQRQSLLQEIQQLEQQRQQMMAEFLERLTHRCTQVIQEQLAASSSTELPHHGSPATSATSIPPLPSSEALASTLDSALKTVFESLGQDLQSYSDSLSQGLQRMHNLGQQGEAKFLAYFNRLQQQLETTLRQPSIMLESSAEGWYLGIDLTTTDLTAILFGFNPQIPNVLPFYPLEETFTLPLEPSSDLENPLIRWKQGLKTLKTHLMAQSNPAKVGDRELSVREIMGQLQGMMLVCPGQWNGGDRAQLQGILLELELVCTPEQIIWVPKAIAVMLAYGSPTEQPTTTLVIDVGKTLTELALIDTQDPFSSLTSQPLPYGWQSLDQDIVCQLVYPQWQSQITQTLPHLQAPFPQPGSPDLAVREGLNQQLQVHPLGEAFLEAAQLTRLILQQQEQFTSSLGYQSWGATRQDLSQHIINPWIEQFNDTLTYLLRIGKTSDSRIGQIILGGEGIETIDYLLEAWLKAKFPQGKVIFSHHEETTIQLAHGLIHIPTLPQPIS